MYVNNAVKISDFGSSANVVSAYSAFEAAPPSADSDYYSGLINVMTVANDLHLQYILPSPYACYSSLLPITFKRDITTSRNATPVIKVIAKSTDTDIIYQLDSNSTLAAFQSISIGDTLVSYNSLPVATWIQQNANKFGGANDGARVSRAVAAMTTLDHAHMLLPQQNSVQMTFQNNKTGLYNVTLNWISRLTVECLNTTYIWKNDTVVAPIPSTPNSPNTLTTIPTIQKCYPGSFSQLFQFNTQKATTTPQQIRSYDGTQCISDFGAFPGNGAAIGLIPCPNSTTSSNSTINTTLWSFNSATKQILNLASSLCVDIDYHWLNASIINNPNNTLAQSQNNTGFVWATLPGTALKQWDCGLNTTANWVISHVNSTSVDNIVQVRTFDGYCWDNHYRSSFNQSLSGSMLGAPAIVVHRRDNFVEMDYDNVGTGTAGASANAQNKKRNDVDHGYSVPFDKRSFNWMSTVDFDHVKRDTTSSNNLTLGEDWSYSYTIINSQTGPVGYIQVKSFTPAAVQSSGDAQQSVQAILNTWVRLLKGPLQNTVALLIDVRENRGGNVLYAMELIQF
ncbi:hypothetical protein HDU76_008750, partial [Blyttiomyces sp. JEL0837]